MTLMGRQRELLEETRGGLRVQLANVSKLIVYYRLFGMIKTLSNMQVMTDKIILAINIFLFIITVIRRS